MWLPCGGLDLGGQEWVQESSEQVSAEGEGGAGEWTDEPS